MNLFGQTGEVELWSTWTFGYFIFLNLSEMSCNGNILANRVDRLNIEKTLLDNTFEEMHVLYIPLF